VTIECGYLYYNDLKKSVVLKFDKAKIVVSKKAKVNYADHHVYVFNQLTFFAAENILI
jgi:hypothetical protein